METFSGWINFTKISDYISNTLFRSEYVTSSLETMGMKHFQFSDTVAEYKDTIFDLIPPIKDEKTRKSVEELLTIFINMDHVKLKLLCDLIKNTDTVKEEKDVSLETAETVKEEKDVPLDTADTANTANTEVSLKTEAESPLKVAEALDEKEATKAVTVVEEEVETTEASETE